MYVGCKITGNPFFRYIWSGVGLSHKKVYKSIFSETDTFETGTPIASSHSHIYGEDGFIIFRSGRISSRSTVSPSQRFLKRKSYITCFTINRNFITW